MARFLSGLLAGLGSTADAERVSLPGPVALPARVPAAELAADAVAALALAAADLADPDGRSRVQLDPVRIAASFRSVQLGRIGGRPPAVWDPLSGFFPSADGWVRTHANYPWHARALASALGTGPDPDRAAVVAAIAERGSRDIEEAVFAAGGLAVAVREAAEWDAERGGTPAPAAVQVRRRGETGRSASMAGAPLAGLRVLDLTRVIAGPVGTRALATLGADVLRVDSPHRPEPLWQWLDTGRGKRSTLLDLDSAAGLRALLDLLETADVLVTASRPGALARFGLEPEQIARERPGLVTARVRAWGSDPGDVPAAPSGNPGDRWAGRRGFDSLVQAATGIASLEAGEDGAPGALPAQVLDHAAGALLAAGVLGLLTDATGGHVEVSLEGCARLLLDAQPLTAEERARIPDPNALPALPEVESAWGALAIAPPALPAPGGAGEEPWRGRAFGEDPPAWR